MNDTLAKIEELDTILTAARESWLAAKTPAEEKKARKQINDALDMRLELMDSRDLSPILDLELK